MKKIFSILLALFLFIFCLSPFAFANELTAENYVFAENITVNKSAKTISIDPMTARELLEALVLAEGYSASICDRSGIGVSESRTLESGFYITITAPDGSVDASFRFVVNEPTPTPLPENTVNLSDDIRVMIFYIAVVGVFIGVIITSIMLNKRSNDRKNGLR